MPRSSVINVQLLLPLTQCHMLWIWDSKDNATQKMPVPGWAQSHYEICGYIKILAAMEQFQKVGFGCTRLFSVQFLVIGVLQSAIPDGAKSWRTRTEQQVKPLHVTWHQRPCTSHYIKPYWPYFLHALPMHVWSWQMLTWSDRQEFPDSYSILHLTSFGEVIWNSFQILDWLHVGCFWNWPRLNLGFLTGSW